MDFTPGDIVCINVRDDDLEFVNELGIIVSVYERFDGCFVIAENHKAAVFVNQNHMERVVNLKISKRIFCGDIAGYKKEFFELIKTIKS